LVDVRTQAEYEKGNIPGSIHIPVDEMRIRMLELNKNEPVYLYCQGGLRGYLAQKILKQNGFNQTLNLSGGYQVWNTCVVEKKASLKLQMELA